MLSNLDRVRKEHYADGTITERTTREWARSIRTLDDKEYAQCNLVNGGTDQLWYLLFPPKDKEAAEQALEAYRRRLYQFIQREAKFREEVGPPPVIQYSKRVIANLDVIQRLSIRGGKYGSCTLFFVNSMWKDLPHKPVVLCTNFEDTMYNI